MHGVLLEVGVQQGHQHLPTDANLEAPEWTTKRAAREHKRLALEDAPDRKRARVHVHLLPNLTCPPTPSDLCWADGATVWCAYAGFPDDSVLTRGVQIGHVDAVLRSSKSAGENGGSEVGLLLRTSGDAWRIPASCLLDDFERYARVDASDS